MKLKKDRPQIWSIDKLLRKNLIIPDYQRPYKWTDKNITDLILDIQKSIEESRKYANFKYRIGTVILHRNESDEYEIVDGQQRILSLLLLKTYLTPGFQCNLSNTKFSNKITQTNLHDNYITIHEWFSSVDNEQKKNSNRALKDTLEVVVIIVNKIDEAFQLFDSQNTRGRALYPHDLLKAYHLREIHDKYEMQNAVVKWESKNPKAIRELFDLYLFPLWNWTKRRKCGNFTTADIDIYKGIEEKTGYTYARRANKAMPYFLLTEPFISGGDFFEMVDHYMLMLRNIKEEIITNQNFQDLKLILADGSDVQTIEALDKACKSSSTGFNYARNLFFCTLLCYYDRFHNFDVMAIKKLLTWAMMIRVDMQHLGFDTINRYAIGLGDNDKYSNAMPVISMITYARKHTEISGMRLNMTTDFKDANEERQNLYNQLRQLNGYGY
ncbi:DUF262 domain-containing protein [Bacteroides helcogenes]|uniref:Uncharacterized protein n=1 Tax=Bacteroides helcogenes (strain ATCC 35417 / DSM 20613 / JCM 6297 / CCUG 15421 / P 36-108) TaxID=693979 RepID=E6SWU2_BACT6|nr:DUF262 domain-containing protein [Bacteroides helcogenes]ADV43644.1 protein of unknown function DUF262 [Bacteroides helcogenes P 36-108]MDY5239365.1 DUF262 domain-containing protein [Bacteroides helcogenes]